MTTVPTAPEALERILAAVDGADWVMVDPRRRRLYLHRGRVGARVLVYDTTTGELADQPWPVPLEVTLNCGAAVAALDTQLRRAVQERVASGF